jgi:hypothetical protein
VIVWLPEKTFARCVSKHFTAIRNTLCVVHHAFLIIITQLKLVKWNMPITLIWGFLTSRGGNDDTPVKICSSPTSDFPKKVVSCLERSTVLPPVFNADKYGSPCVQSEHLNGACIIYLIKPLVDAVYHLT